MEQQWKLQFLASLHSLLRSPQSLTSLHYTWKEPFNIPMIRNRNGICDRRRLKSFYPASMNPNPNTPMADWARNVVWILSGKPIPSCVSEEVLGKSVFLAIAMPRFLPFFFTSWQWVSLVKKTVLFSATNTICLASDDCLSILCLSYSS